MGDGLGEENAAPAILFPCRLGTALGIAAKAGDMPSRRAESFARSFPRHSPQLERFRAKWRPVRVKKTRQIKNLETRFDSIETEKAVVCHPRGFVCERRCQIRSDEENCGARRSHRYRRIAARNLDGSRGPENGRSRDPARWAGF